MSKRALLLLTPLLAVACPTPTPPSREPEPVAPSEPVDASPLLETLPDAGPADAAADRTPDAAPAEPLVGSTAEYFRCGDGKCRSGSETCCGASNRGVCLPSSPDDAPQGKVGYLKTQWEICDKTALEKTGYSMSHIDRCDESIDCKKGELCCDNFLFSGGTIGECVKLPAGGSTPCDYGERCIESSTCRLPGSQCIEGYCKKPVPNLPCGDSPCSGSTPYCCGSTQSCASKCESWHQVRCARHADCLAGQRCTVSGYGSACLSIIQDRDSQQTVCKLDGECNYKCNDGSRPRCKTSVIPWIKSCQCP